MTHDAPKPGFRSEPIRVLWISCVGEKGGAEVYMLNLLRRMRRESVGSSVALLRPGPLESDLKELGVGVLRFHPHRMRELGKVAQTVLKLARAIQAQGFDLVMSNGFRAHVYGGLAAALAGVPALWGAHTAEAPGWSTELILRIPVAEVIANCPRTQAFFANRGLRTTLLWPTVDEEQLSVFTPRAELARRYGVPESARWVCMASRLQRYKGHEFFIRAIASLPPALSDVHGIIIGGTLFGMEPDYPGQLRQLAAQLGVASRIHFPGFVEDSEVRGFVQGSEILVHPALDEDFGMIVAEAQAIGRPVVAFASVGPASIIEHERTGHLVPVGDAGALGESLCSLLSEPERARRFGGAGRERSLRLFSARTAAAHLESTCARLLAGG